MNFAIYFAGDAYSTSKKIMGRQSAGKAFLRGVVRSWPRGPLRAIVHDNEGAKSLARQLSGDGYHGDVRHSSLPNWGAADEAGAVYYPAPPPKDFAFSRSLIGPTDFSIFGVTHTLSSTGAMDQVADLIMPPFQPWDALICTSSAAKTFVSHLHEEMREYWRDTIGATRFVDIQLPKIPLGVDAPAFACSPAQRKAARVALGVLEGEVAFLFAGRLSFHAKANPAPLYQALEKASAKNKQLVCIEAGLHPNDVIAASFREAQRALAPSVRFISVDGRNERDFENAWRGADVFVSLSDNVQETFGLTPVEAMAAGLPVLVSDWNGYKDTIRDGVDGYRIPTTLPPPGIGGDLGVRYALGQENYDFFIGRTSLATVVDPDATAQAIERMAGDVELRKSMGEAGRLRALSEFDWPVILQRYSKLVAELAEIRVRAGKVGPSTPPSRADPFHRFSHFPSAKLGGDWIVFPRPNAKDKLEALKGLAMTNYGFNLATLPADGLGELLFALLPDKQMTVNALLATNGRANPVGVRLLMWLWKFDLIAARAPGG